MLDLFVNWWVIPVAVVTVLFLLMLRHDGTKVTEFDDEDWGVFVLFTAVWPLGVIVMILVVADWLRDE